MWNYRDRWRDIGEAMDIDAGTLEAIDVNNAHDVEGCLPDMIAYGIYYGLTYNIVKTALQSVGAQGMFSYML